MGIGVGGDTFFYGIDRELAVWPGLAPLVKVPFTLDGRGMDIS